MAINSSNYPKTLKSVRGLSVAITGTCWVGRKTLVSLIRKKGGILGSTCGVTGTTDILIRGRSQFWKYKNHGLKEAKAAKLIQEGKHILIVPDYEFRKLIERGKSAHTTDTIAGQPIEWLNTPSKKDFIQSCRTKGPLDREYTAQGRLEQGYLRSQLFGNKSSSKCAICAREFPTELLIAAHIKPRSECSFAERCDADNIVFPLCLFGCDSLYERGVIGVDHKGCVAVSSTGGMPVSVKHYLKSINGKRCGSWKKSNAKYFQWHYEWRLRK